MALEDADGPTSPRLSIRTEIDGRGPPLDIILQIVYKSNQETEERQITLKNSVSFTNLVVAIKLFAFHLYEENLLK